MEISPIRFKKFLDKIQSNGFGRTDFYIQNNVDNCQFLEFKSKQVNDSTFSWKRCGVFNRIIVIPSYNAITDIQNEKEPDEDISEAKALKYFDEWLECLNVKIGIEINITGTENKTTYLNAHDVLLNWLPNNMNNLFKLIVDSNFKQEDFGQDEERWGGDNFPMSENQRKALRIFWKSNPQYRFVWHETNRRTQTYFEPVENVAFRYNKNYSLHDNSGVLIIGEVNREFKNWLIELKKRLNEEKIAKERSKNIENKSNRQKASVAPSSDISLENDSPSNNLIDWDFDKK